MKIAIYPGTFDPITLGHRDIIERGCRLFDKVIVAVAHSHGKNPLFDLAQRTKLVEVSTADLAQVEVINFSGLLVELAKQYQACAILRGIRTTADFEYENQLANMNNKLSPNFETVYLGARDHQACISSTLIREIARLQGDISPYVPQAVTDAVDKLKPRY